jgi:hypothetical protein
VPVDGQGEFLVNPGAEFSAKIEFFIASTTVVTKEVVSFECKGPEGRMTVFGFPIVTRQPVTHCILIYMFWALGYYSTAWWCGICPLDDQKTYQEPEQAENTKHDWLWVIAVSLAKRRFLGYLDVRKGSRVMTSEFQAIM